MNNLRLFSTFEFRLRYLAKCQIFSQYSARGRMWKYSFGHSLYFILYLWHRILFANISWMKIRNLWSVLLFRKQKYLIIFGQKLKIPAIVRKHLALVLTRFYRITKYVSLLLLKIFSEIFLNSNIFIFFQILLRTSHFRLRSVLIGLLSWCQILQHVHHRKMVFCYQNCSDLLWEKIVLVIEKNFWNSRLKAQFLRSLEQFIQTVKGQNNLW